MRLPSWNNACHVAVFCSFPPVPPLAGLPRYDIESVDPLELSTEMKQFVAEYVGRHSAVDDRAWRLSWALLDSNVLDFEYDPQVTLTAAEAFRTAVEQYRAADPEGTITMGSDIPRVDGGGTSIAPALERHLHTAMGAAQQAGDLRLGAIRPNWTVDAVIQALVEDGEVVVHGVGLHGLRPAAGPLPNGRGYALTRCALERVF